MISLKNGLDISERELNNTYLYYSKEILVLMGSSTTKDPESHGTIYDTINNLKNSKICVNILSLCNKINICNEITKETNGIYEVMQSPMKFDQRFLSFANPVERADEIVINTLFMVAFPQLIFSEMPILCVCHKLFKYFFYITKFPQKTGLWVFKM